MKVLMHKKIAIVSETLAKLNLERMRNKVYVQNLILTSLKKKKIPIAEGESHILGRITKFEEDMKIVFNQGEFQEKRLQEKKDRFNVKLKEVEDLHSDISLRAIEKFKKCEEEISKMTGESWKDPQFNTSFLAKWTEITEKAQNLINQTKLLGNIVQEFSQSEQVDSQCRELESKIINWEKDLEQILNDRNELIEGLKFMALETDSKPSQDIKDLESKICQLEKANQKLKNSYQKMKEEFEPKLQQSKDEIERSKKTIQEKDALLEGNKDKLLEKDLKITELLCELAKDKKTQEQTEEMRIKLEEMQKSTQVIIHEKDLQIGELQKDLDGFIRRVEKALNKPSELDHREYHQDEDLQVKEESGIENRSSCLKIKIAEILEKAVSIAQEADHKLIEKDSESLGDEDLISTLRAQISKKNVELLNIRASLENNYVSREDHYEVIKKMQEMIDAEKSKYSSFFNIIHEKVSEEASKFVKEEVRPENQYQKQPEELTLKDNFSFNFEKEGQKDVSLKNFNRNGKRPLDDLFANFEKNYDKKSASKLNNEKENIGFSLSQEKNLKPKEPITIDTDDEDLGGFDEIKKKIKQE